MIPRQFPQSWGPYPTIIPAPAVVKCCRQPGGKCPPIRQTCIQFTKYGPGGCDNFFTQLFSPLNFSIDDPFYFHYGYMSTGTDRAARFTAGAYGDLDCDDAWSTYERAGSVDSLWNVTGSGLYVHDDIE
jgi:hypothetical protein